ncbi:MAG: nucleotide exchange factor GrpE [Anaerolineales bacterium]|nr:nucleotide exchange factor GrpE [Anaerolineales bacterium]
MTEEEKIPMEASNRDDSIPSPDSPLEESIAGEGSDAQASQAADAIPPDDIVAALEAEIERLQAESHEYLDGWQRARADFINFKRRITEENSNLRARIAGDILTHFFSILDDLDLALENRPEEEINEAWIAGIELIRQKLILILQNEGVESIPTEPGSYFDPTLHEAVTYEDDDDHEEGDIISVIKQGYRLNDRVLRPVQVRVAK